jgi:hypothetical protein
VTTRARQRALRDLEVGRNGASGGAHQSACENRAGTAAVVILLAIGSVVGCQPNPNPTPTPSPTPNPTTAPAPPPEPKGESGPQRPPQPQIVTQSEGRRLWVSGPETGGPPASTGTAAAIS